MFTCEQTMLNSFPTNGAIDISLVDNLITPKEFSMLILSRKPGKSFKIELQDTIDPNMPVKELFTEGPIEILVIKVSNRRVRLGINASRDFAILRDEIYD